MPTVKFLFALSSLAIFSCSNAISIDNHIVNRHVAHDTLAKRGGLARRCKQGSSSVVPSSSSSTPAASTPTVTPSTSETNSGTKLGLAWAGAPDSLALLSGKAKFLYNWDSSAPSNAKDLGFTYVPELWGSAGDKVNRFKATVVQGYSTHVLGFNEPNEAGQSNMSPEQGAQLWMQNIQPLKALGYQLITPGTSSRPDGKDWVKNFMAACTGCTFDKIAIHWYDTNLEKFKTYVNGWHDAFNMPIWITEYGCVNFNNDGQPQPNNDQIWQFHVDAANWLKTLPWVEVAMPYGFMENINIPAGNQLIAQGGKDLTPLGHKLVEIFNS